MIRKILQNLFSIPIAVIAGVFLGLGVQSNIFLVLQEIIGLYYELLIAIAVPIVFLSLIVTITKLAGDFKVLRKIIWLLFLGFGILLLLVGAIFLGHQGISSSNPLSESQRSELYSSNDSFDKETTIYSATSSTSTTVWGPNGLIFDIIRTVIPENLFSAIYTGELYGIVFMSILLGIVFVILSKKETNYFVDLSDGLSSALEKIYRVILSVLPIILVPSVASIVVQMTATEIPFSFLIPRYVLIFGAIIGILFVALITIIARNDGISTGKTAGGVFRIISLSFFGGSNVIAFPEVVHLLNPHPRRRAAVKLFFSLIIPLNLGFFAIIVFTVLTSLEIYNIDLTIWETLQQIFSLGQNALFLSFEQLLNSLDKELIYNTDQLGIFLQVPLVALASILVPFGRVVSVLSSLLISVSIRSQPAYDAVMELSKETSKAEIPEEKALLDVQDDTALDQEELSPGHARQSEDDKEDLFGTEVKKKHKRIRFKANKSENITSIPFRISVLLLMLVMLAGYGVVTTIVNYSGTRVSMQGVTNVIMDENLRHIERRIEDYFSQAKSSITTIELLFDSEYVDIDSFDELESIFSDTIIEKNDTIASVFLGLQNGEFLLVGREIQGEGLRRRRFTLEGNDVREVYIFDSDPLLTVDRIVADPYDPRLRPWYIRAAEKQGPAWTNVYVFASSDVIGATYAHPFYDDDGNLIGVIGIDVDLGDFSVFLSELSVATQAQALIYIFERESNELIAISSDSTEAGARLYYQNEESETFDPIRYRTVDSPDSLVRASFDSFNNLDTQRTGQSEFLSRLLSSDILQTLSRQISGVSSNAEPTDLGDFSRFTLQNRYYYGIQVDAQFSESFDWKIGMVIPEGPLLEIATRGVILQFMVTVLIFIIIAVLTSMLVSRLTLPLEFLSDEMRDMSKLKIDHRLGIRSNISEVNNIDKIMGTLKQGLDSFSRYLPTEVVRELLRINKAATIGAEKMNITLFFSDIQNFTQLSEVTKPEILLEQLKEYFNILSTCIMNEQGTIDKYIGDAVMAFWGAPWKIDDHALRACRAAIRCSRGLYDLPPNDFQKTRIGIHSGVVLVGNVGSDQRLNYTALGDGVNLASRLESLNKFYGTSILISEETMKQLDDSIVYRFVDHVMVKGKSEVTSVYEILKERDDISLWPVSKYSHDIEKRFLFYYQEAVYFFKRKNWGKAVHNFANALKLIPDDLPTRKLYEKSYRLYRDGGNSKESEVTQLFSK